MAVSVTLSEVQRAALTAACDTFVPSLDVADDPHGLFARSGSDIGVPEAMEQKLATLQEEELDGMRQLLDGLVAQGLTPEAPQELREQIVHGVAESGPDGLAGISALKGLALLLFYALPDPETGRNPNWAAIGYPGPVSAPPDVPKPIQPIVPSGDEMTLTADVCVIGSGAGGGVAAAKLAAAGKEVIVLEAGGYYNESDFNQLELWAYENIYREGGITQTANGSITIQAGSNLGGGTTVNWTNCIRTNGWVRDEWASVFGLEGLDGPDYDRHLDTVIGRIGVTDACSDYNGPHQRLEQGCEKLGYPFRKITRNTDPSTYSAENAGFLGYGDQSGSKQGTLKTFLMDAHEQGARFVVRCRADRVLTENGRAAGVEATYTGPEGDQTRVVVKAPQVVVAASALDSPALLLRSGIGGPAVGDYLRLHPATAVLGVYDEPQKSWWGPPQSGLTDVYSNLEDGHGFLIEGAHTSPGLFGSAVPWQSGRQHKEFMSTGAEQASFVFLIRDRGHGKVTIDHRGNAVHHYDITDELDERIFRRGMEEMVKLHDAAGAQEILTFHRKLLHWKRGQDVDAFRQTVHDAPVTPYDSAIFALHQMGSCRMGKDPSTSVADPWGQLHDTKGVWIGDASCFPTATGTNPMVTTMAMAHRTSEAIVASSD